MNGLRFKVGDMARVVVSRGPHSQKHLNDVVEIRRVIANGKLDLDGCPIDYATICGCDADSRSIGCSLVDWQLQPINPQPEPESMTRTRDEEVTA